MPSPDLLPKGRSFPSVVAPPLDSVLNRARRRRARQAGAISVLAVAAAVAVALVFVPHGSSQSLDVVTPAVPDRTSSPAAHLPAVRVVPRAPTAPKAATSDGSAATQPVTAAQHSATAGTTSHASQSTTESAPAFATPIVGPAHRMTRYDPSRPCAGNGPNATTGWCSYYDGATSGSAGQSVTLATAVCRLPGQGTGVLTSSNGRQADFAVGKNAYPSVWTWSHGRRFTKTSTSISVPTGTCVEWFVSWRVVNNAGEPLTAGRYYLDASPDMWSATGSASAGTQNPITFTVR